MATPQWALGDKVKSLPPPPPPLPASSCPRTPRSSSHCPTGSSVASTSHASPPRGPTPSFRCRPSVPRSAQIKLNGKTECPDTRLVFFTHPAELKGVQPSCECAGRGLPSLSRAPALDSQEGHAPPHSALSSFSAVRQLCCELRGVLQAPALAPDLFCLPCCVCFSALCYSPSFLVVKGQLHAGGEACGFGSIAGVIFPTQPPALL